jgi:hypothetical protein
MGDQHRLAEARGDRRGAGVENVLPKRGKGVGGRRAGNNLPLGRVGLIHLLLLEKNRSDSRNGCGSREMRLD